MPIYDRCGSLALLVDDSGAIVSHTRYTAFGEFQSSGIKSPWMYSNKRLDEETGFVFFSRRYYEVLTGRWTTKDPIGFADGPNLYAYVHNDPMRYVDYEGLTSKTANYQFYSQQAKYVKGMNKKTLNKIIDYASRDIGKRRVLKGGQALENGRITFGNGIFNNLKDLANTTQMLSDLSGGYQVTGIYNDSRGPGAFKAFFESLGYKTKEVMNLRTEFCRSFLELAQKRSEGTDVRHFHISHSQGGIQTKHALRGLPDPVRQHVEVLNINGGKVVPEKYCFRATNLQSSGDIVPHFDVGGQIKYRKQIETVKAHKDAGWLDHTVNSPTFTKLLTKETLDFIDRYK